MKRIILVFFVLLLTRAIYAQERYILTSDSVKLYVNVKGTGTPCLYIHGGPGAGSYFLEKLTGDFLEQHFQIIYLDQRGAGRSASPKDNNYSMDRMVKDFEEVRNAIGIDQWITLGHSFGGILQMGYLQRYPKVVKGMIMINCTLNMKESFSTSWFPKACEFLNISDQKFYFDDALPFKVRLDSLIIQLIRKDIIWKMSFSSKKDNESMNATISDMPHGNRDFENIAFSINDYFIDFTKETRKNNIPVLFYYGKKDWCVGPEHYKDVNFTNMILWASDGEHMMPFLKNKPDLEKAINSYIEKYKF
jgi:proline iminopeptidase